MFSNSPPTRLDSPQLGRASNPMGNLSPASARNQGGGAAGHNDPNLSPNSVEPGPNLVEHNPHLAESDPNPPRDTRDSVELARERPNLGKLWRHSVRARFKSAQSRSTSPPSWSPQGQIGPNSAQFGSNPPPDWSNTKRMRSNPKALARRTARAIRRAPTRKAHPMSHVPPWRREQQAFNQFCAGPAKRSRKSLPHLDAIARPPS